MDKKDEQTVETPKQKANKAVHTAALGAATVAATPIPFADLFYQIGRAHV